MSKGSETSAVLGNTNSNDPRDLERRIFVGNLPTRQMERKDLEDMFSPYGKIHALSLFTGYGFVQFEHVEDAEAAKAGHKGKIFKGYKLDINMAAERRANKQQNVRPSPPRREKPGGVIGREPPPRSRSPRDRGEPRGPRPAVDPYERYRERGFPGREKEPSYRDEYERYYGAGPEDYYGKKEDPYRDPYRDPWNGRGREPKEVETPEVRKRNELYRQYYEKLQQRCDSDRPVDCSVIVVNKVQNREYAETVGRKIRDLGMVVDLIFLNTEVSLTQALEDVSRANTPFAIIITQQHQVHRSCTVNILFGTPQEHRNMPMEDAMGLVAQSYETYKVENAEKERTETAKKAAEMADEVLLREADRESHPVSLLPTITLLYENRYLTPEELESLSSYLQDKKNRLIRRADPHAAVGHPPSAAPHQASPAPPHQAHQSHQASANPANPNPKDLQAKILSLFNSGVGPAPTSTPGMVPPVPSYSSPSGVPAPSLAPYTSAPPAGYGAPPSRVPGGTRGGINFDNPSVQKALDTLTQAPHSASSGNGQGMGPPQTTYPQTYPTYYYPS